MKRYDVRFCSCGRIHIMPFDEFNWLEEDYENRRIIRICKNCGNAFVTWLTENLDNGFDINSCDLKDWGFEVWNTVKTYYSKGIRVYMNSGREADTFQSDYFGNCDEWSSMNDSGYQPIEKAERERKDWATVDTKRLIRDIEREYKDEADNILRSISGYGGVRIHWEGTKYEKDWNK